MPQGIEGSFRTHAHYIDAMRQAAGWTWATTFEGALSALSATADTAGWTGEVAPQGIDLEIVHRCMRNAWSTEMLMALPGDWAAEDELMRISNTWAVVQGYYVGYHASQALCVAKGMARPTTHPATQNQYVNLWVQRPVALPPWTFGVAAANVWINPPGGAILDDSISPWTTCTPANCHSLMAKAIRTTRDDSVDRAVARAREMKRKARNHQWCEEEAVRVAAGRPPRTQTNAAAVPRLTPGERAEVEARTRTHSFLDYMFRLRIGANYNDSAVFTDGPTIDGESAAVHLHLVFLASATLLLAELRLRDLVGRTTLAEWVDAFIATNLPTGRMIGLARRRHLLLA